MHFTGATSSKGRAAPSGWTSEYHPQQLKTALFFDVVVFFFDVEGVSEVTTPGRETPKCQVSAPPWFDRRERRHLLLTPKHNKHSGFPLLRHQTFTPSIINVASGLARRGGPREREVREKHAFSESDSSVCVFYMCSFIFKKNKKKNLSAKQDETKRSYQSGSLLICEPSFK